MTTAFSPVGLHRASSIDKLPLLGLLLPLQRGRHCLPHFSGLEHGPASGFAQHCLRLLPRLLSPRPVLLSLLVPLRCHSLFPDHWVTYERVARRRDAIASFKRSVFRGPNRSLLQTGCRGSRMAGRIARAQRAKCLKSRTPGRLDSGCLEAICVILACRQRRTLLGWLATRPEAAI